MEFVLDFQGFKSERNEFIVKELALISTGGGLYELQLFQPPCEFNKLTEDVKKQVVWLEKQHHGLFWGSGFRDYSELKDMFKNVNICGTVYVKGSEKKKFVKTLLSAFNVEIIDLDDMGCPKLDVLKQKMLPYQMKPCTFNHNTKNCAYLNVYVLLEWLRCEKYALSRLEKVNCAIRECYSRGFMNLQPDVIRLLPKEVILNYHENVSLIYNKLPESLQKDEDVIMNLPCNEHYMYNCETQSSYDHWDGANPKRKNCHFCKANKTSSEKSC